MKNSNDNGPDSPILHYLRKIEAKLDRLNERLDNFVSAPKRKRATRTGDADVLAEGRRVVVVGVPKEAEEDGKNKPDDDAVIIVTGVPRAGRDD
jgi:hypothetical protein